MAIYGNLKDYRFENDAEDIRGADVYGANDEKLGEIDDVIFDSNSGELKYVVIDTGGWLTSKRFIVPALQLTIREEGDEDYYVNLTKEQVERFPEYNEERLSTDEEWTDYERRYERSIEDGPIMHAQGSTRMITPEPSQVESIDSGRTPVDPAAVTPRRIASDQPRFGATSPSDAMVTESGSLAGHIEREPVAPMDSSMKVSPSERRGLSRGRRFDDFQERLRRDREEILRRRAA
ncbi:MAG TPA: PRC-barrel domain-containing protein [Terriglobales bacterium]|nr:PRC-barrel domain-containing protein [Terriglobales bacterium]